MSIAELRLGLIGCGTVGGSFLKALRSRQAIVQRQTGLHVRPVSVAVARPHLPRPAADGIPVHGDAAAIAADERIPIVVEASGAPQADDWILTALARGAVVVTAHKQALARNPRLLDHLADHDEHLYCEAAVAAALPIVRNLRSSLSCDEVKHLSGILNGTTNFILSELEVSSSFEDALQRAQQAGFAEADPSADLSGADAAAKLAILCTIAWRTPLLVSEIATRGIDGAIVGEAHRARRDGRRLKLVARASRNGQLHASVQPECLSETDLLATANGVENVIQVHAALAGELSWRGAGAGGMATASSLLADVVAAANFLKARAYSRRTYVSLGC